MPYADYQRHLEENRNRQKTERGAANHARAVRSYRQRNAKKRAAHNAIAKALMFGKIVPWPCCAVPECNVVEVEAHHPDYDAPLDVVWLCNAHHTEVHRLFKQLDKRK